MAQSPKLNLKRAVFLLLAACLISSLLYAAVAIYNLTTHPPAMAYQAIATALQRDNQRELQNWSTPRGYRALRDMSRKYGQKRLGLYLARHLPVEPYMHAPGTMAILLTDSKSIDVVLFFHATRKGWQLSSIHGTPIFNPPGKRKTRNPN